ncbi:MAG: hypothetical protein U1F77_00865 [Kiritimatiellia bacterium]
MNVPNNITLNGGALSGGMDSGTVANTYSGTLTLGAGGGTLTTWWSDKTLTVANPIAGAGNLTVDLLLSRQQCPECGPGHEQPIRAPPPSPPARRNKYRGRHRQPGRGNVVNNSILFHNRTGANTVSNTITGTGATAWNPATI